MGSKADRRAARERVGAYHEACLAELVEHVGAAIDDHRAGRMSAVEVDAVIHRYHRAAQEMWKFCWGGGSGAHIEMVAAILERDAEAEVSVDWWERGASRGRWSGSQ